ncbi:hypothetical protein CBFG_05612 [Clostridiales bacterium 1_7_47FAA]|nr:hypothetical protein CBFG_05612 [Clostridiales bacterium 1_7_47FAA]
MPDTDAVPEGIYFPGTAFLLTFFLISWYFLDCPVPVWFKMEVQKEIGGIPYEDKGSGNPYRAGPEKHPVL